jgi:hypothetical protein
MYFQVQELKIIFYFHVHCASQLARSRDLIALSGDVRAAIICVSGQNSSFRTP